MWRRGWRSQRKKWCFKKKMMKKKYQQMNLQWDAYLLCPSLTEWLVCEYMVWWVRRCLLCAGQAVIVNCFRPKPLLSTCKCQIELLDYRLMKHAETPLPMVGHMSLNNHKRPHTLYLSDTFTLSLLAHLVCSTLNHAVLPGLRPNMWIESSVFTVHVWLRAGKSIWKAVKSCLLYNACFLLFSLT